MTKVKFHLPGLRANFPINMIFCEVMALYPEYFMPGAEPGSFYGEFPCSRWNGGRVSIDDQCDNFYIEHVIADLKRIGVPLRFTYTNPLITEKDLDDKYCNYCMKVADTGMNEVIVVSPILEEYIRKNYPRYKLNSSTCKEIRDFDKLNEELKKDYNLVVLDYNFNNQFDLLNSIERKDKCEVLINPCCEPNCKRRGEHYKTMAEIEMTALDNRSLPEDKKQPVKKWDCKFEHLPTIYSICKHSTFVSFDALWNKYVPMGFTNFKIEGRVTDQFSLIDTYCYYMAKPEHRDAVRMLCLLKMEASRLVVFGKPRRGEWKEQ